MQKTAPSIGRVLTMVLFALSCFGLLLFLWLSFGGSIPLRAEGYRFTAKFPEASTLVEQADVRLAGVNVGKVRTRELDSKSGRTLVEIELEEKYSPIPRDTRAILRQKTLLGETFVELTPGSTTVPKLAEGAELTRANVEPTTELDELLRIFRPSTQKAFRDFVAEQANSIEGGTSQDLNDALGNLPQFTTDGADVLQVLDEQDQAVTQLVRNTGITFAALNEQEGALRELIVNADNTFDATQQEQVALAETIEVFPTFLRESRLTLDRLEKFSLDTRPLVNDLKPVADDLGPTVRDLGDLSPDLVSLFRDLDPLIDSSRTTLPEASRFLRGARPVLRSLHVFLPELNPILAFLNTNQAQVTDFITVGGAALNIRSPGSGDTPVHLLSQLALLGGDSFRFGRDERPSRETEMFPERGNAYLGTDSLTVAGKRGIQESFDCAPANGEVRRPKDEGEAGTDRTPGVPPGKDPPEAPCAVQENYGPGFTDGRYPLLKGLQKPITGGRDVPTPSPPADTKIQDR